MKVLQVNEHDSRGGAARAARTLHESLLNEGIDSWMFVQKRTLDDPRVIGPEGKFKQGLGLVRGPWDTRRLRKYPEREGAVFSPNLLKDRYVEPMNLVSADIQHLHWIGSGFLQIESLSRLKGPLVWTLHDQWAMTGGCHNSFGCERFTAQCGSCPVLHSTIENDLSRTIYLRKRRAWPSLNLHIVTPSRWLGEDCQRSSLLSRFPNTVIPNGLNLKVFRPWDKRIAREALDLPQDKLCVLFGAMAATSDKNKGFAELVQALQHLREDREIAERIILLIFGAFAPSSPPNLGFPVRYMGVLHDNPTIAMLYSSADVVVVPSLYENFPTTALEAAACGVPCTGFATTGVKEIIEDGITGFLAKPYDALELARAIGMGLRAGPQMHADARKRAEDLYDWRATARAHIKLYESILESGRA